MPALRRTRFPITSFILELPAIEEQIRAPGKRLDDANHARFFVLTLPAALRHQRCGGGATGLARRDRAFVMIAAEPRTPD
jgi:hypothetical protein